MDLSKVQSLEFPELERLSQSCSKKILFDLLDKKYSIEESKSQIIECKILLDEYRKRLLINHNIKNLNPLES